MNERTPDERGFAMVAILLLLIVVSMLGTASLLRSTDDQSAATSMFESVRALYAAEAGMNATLETWDLFAYDEALARHGDSLVVDWTPLENRCDYRVVVRRIGGIGHGIYSITSAGRGPGLRGAMRTVSLVVKAKPAIPGNAVTVGGDLTISGNPTISGACGNAHANGSTFQIEGNVVAEGDVSGAGDVLISGSVEDENGDPVTGQSDADEQPIPDLDPMDYCGEADYFLRGGYIVDVAADDSTFILGSTSNGWRYDGTKYETANNSAANGTVCADDDIELAHGIGSQGPPPYTPVPMTLISSGSIRVSANPHITGSHPSGIMMMAGGDLAISGNGSSGSNNYEGLFYADSQCEVSGTPIIQGMLVCRDEPNPFGSENWVSVNDISGDAEIRYECGSFFGEEAVEPIRERAWDQIID